MYVSNLSALSWWAVFCSWEVKLWEEIWLLISRSYVVQPQWDVYQGANTLPSNLLAVFGGMLSLGGHRALFDMPQQWFRTQKVPSSPPWVDSQLSTQGQLFSRNTGLEHSLVSPCPAHFQGYAESVLSSSTKMCKLILKGNFATSSEFARLDKITKRTMRFFQLFDNRWWAVRREESWASFEKEDSSRQRPVEMPCCPKPKWVIREQIMVVPGRDMLTFDLNLELEPEPLFWAISL